MQHLMLANVAAKDQIWYSSTSARNALLLHGITDPWCGLCEPAPQLVVLVHAAATGSLRRAGAGVVFLALLLAAI